MFNYVRRSPDRSQKGRTRFEAGFTLLELLVAMSIFIIVIALVYGMLQIGRVDRNRSSRRTDILKNARIAVHMIGRDALNAGLGYHRKGAVAPDNFVSTRFGLPPDVDTTRDLITSVIAGNDIHPNDLASNAAARTDVIGFCFRDMDFNDGDVIGLNDVDPLAGNPAVPRLAANPVGPSARNDLFLVESQSSQVAIMATNIDGTYIEAGPGDPLGLNQPLNGVGDNGSVLRICNPPVGDPPVPDENCTPYDSTTAKRFFMVGYRIKPDGTLVRTTLGNNRAGINPEDQIQEQPLAYNVEDFQITYVLADGTVTSNPTAGPDGNAGTGDDDVEQFNQIRQITVSIRVQSNERDEQTGRLESIAFTATFSARNMEYDAG
jgi:prepilin-type N-terminal cleavage/methylation domain-containing protein